MKEFAAKPRQSDGASCSRTSRFVPAIGDRRPQRLPVDGARADVGPAVVLGDAGRRDILDVKGGDLAGKPVELGTDVAAGAGNPAEVRLPVDAGRADAGGRSAATRRAASHIRRRGCARRASGRPRRGPRRGREPGGERLPARDVGRALLRERERHDHGLEAERLGDVDRRLAVGVESDRAGYARSGNRGRRRRACCGSRRDRRRRRRDRARPRRSRSRPAPRAGPRSAGNLRAL